VPSQKDEGKREGRREPCHFDVIHKTLVGLRPSNPEQRALGLKKLIGRKKGRGKASLNKQTTLVC